MFWSDEDSGCSVESRLLGGRSGRGHRLGEVMAFIQAGNLCGLVRGEDSEDEEGACFER